MSLRIAITGSTGLIGSKLVSFLLQQGHQITQITRQSALKSAQTAIIVWDPATGKLNADELEDFDVIIHLAGENIGERWTDEQKRSIIYSRVQGTRFLCKVLAALKNKPKVLLAASAIGIYGDQPSDKELDEHSPSGKGFLADVCKRWEEETLCAEDLGIRLVNMRFGMVLSKSGGALAKMWLPFQLGLGGILGSGKQMMSWITLDEIPPIVMHLINNEKIKGPVNVVAPNPVSNKEFTKTLGQLIHRPTLFPMPVFMVKFLFGEMGEALILGGSTVMPKRLLASHYQFQYPDIKSGLQKAIS